MTQRRCGCTEYLVVFHWEKVGEEVLVSIELERDFERNKEEIDEIYRSQ